MPKVYDTRKQKARELLRKLEDGPSLIGDGWTPEQEKKIKADYDLWAQSWIIPKIKELVRELHPEKPKDRDKYKHWSDDPKNRGIA